MSTFTKQDDGRLDPRLWIERVWILLSLWCYSTFRVQNRTQATVTAIFNNDYAECAVFWLISLFKTRFVAAALCQLHFKSRFLAIITTISDEMYRKQQFITLQCYDNKEQHLTSEWRNIFYKPRLDRFRFGRVVVGRAERRKRLASRALSEFTSTKNTRSRSIFLE